MPRPFSPKVVTANDLVLGDVVYLTAATRWTRDLSEADVLTDEADAQLRLLEAEAQSHEVVGAYLADVTLLEGQPRPAHFREAFRAKGPSNYLHGKQERL
ncbi:DUF2849 domain-containing protein [Primorskyibacter sp. S187A]|uniref:DUF2849 domain-containing protein n=1 Tax=Primorskyibacter sp. S187A TaxID=3415130 RepID=UPI003C7C4EE0